MPPEVFRISINNPNQRQQQQHSVSCFHSSVIYIWVAHICFAVEYSCRRYIISQSVRQSVSQSHHQTCQSVSMYICKSSRFVVSHKCHLFFNCHFVTLADQTVRFYAVSVWDIKGNNQYHNSERYLDIRFDISRRINHTNRGRCCAVIHFKYLNHPNRNQAQVSQNVSQLDRQSVSQSVSQSQSVCQ